LSAAGVLSGTPTTAGTFSFTVTASNGVGAAASVASTVTIAPANTPNKADLTLSITATPAQPKVNTAYSFTVKVTNTGPAAATNVKTLFALPYGSQFVSATGSPVKVGQVLIWTTPSLAKNANATFTVTVKSPTIGTKLALGVTASTQVPDPKPGTNIALTTVKVIK
jgi:uncharacterized repeat protein (TIGR01451 family)